MVYLVGRDRPCRSLVHLVGGLEDQKGSQCSQTITHLRCGEVAVVVNSLAAESMIQEARNLELTEVG